MKDDETVELERNPKNGDTGNKTLDKLLNVIWLRSGNVVNEQKRANGGSRHNNLRFVLIALVFGAIVVGLYFALPHIGRGLEWLLKNL